MYRYLSCVSSTSVVALASLTIVASIASGCQSLLREPYTAEVGSVSMTATCLGRWEDVRGKLTPNFDLKDGDDALSLVFPETARFQNQRFDAESLGVAATFPATEAPASVGDDGSLGGRTAASLLGIQELLGDDKLGIDPLLRYQLANALFQEVQLLNEYITRTAVPEGYTPYVVRLLVRPDVNPWFSDTDVDAYTTFSFFKDAIIPEPDEVRVLPLLVTDHIEAALASRSAEELRRLAIVLSIADNKIGGSANYQDVLNTLESSVAREQNSLLSVSRESENSIRVRLGGNYTTQSRQIATRNHPITLVLLVRNTEEELQERSRRLTQQFTDKAIHFNTPEITVKDGKTKVRLESVEGRSIHITSFTRFRLTYDLDEPRILNAPFQGASEDVVFTRVTPVANYASMAREALLDTLVSGHTSGASPLASARNSMRRARIWRDIKAAINRVEKKKKNDCKSLDSSEASAEILRIALLAAANDSVTFKNDIRAILTTYMDNNNSSATARLLNPAQSTGHELEIEQILWSTFVEMFGETEYGRTSVSLPLLRKPAIHSAIKSDGRPLVVQVGAKTSRFLLSGTNLDAGNIQAVLTIKKDDSDHSLITASHYRPNADGTLLAVDFETEGLFGKGQLNPTDGYITMRWLNPEYHQKNSNNKVTISSQWIPITVAGDNKPNTIPIIFTQRQGNTTTPVRPAAIDIRSISVSPETIGNGNDIVLRLSLAKGFDSRKIKLIQLDTNNPAQLAGGTLHFASTNGHTVDTRFTLTPAAATTPNASAHFLIESMPKPGESITFTLTVIPQAGEGERYTVRDSITYNPPSE